MTGKTITKNDIQAFSRHLVREEKSGATVSKYLRDVMGFMALAGDEPLTKETVMAYKKHLINQSYAASA